MTDPPAQVPTPGESPYALRDPVTGEAVAPTDKTQAVLSYALAIVAGFVVPLVFRLTSGRRSSYVRAHATAALNAMVCHHILAVVALVLLFTTEAIELLLLIDLLLLVYVILVLVFLVQGALAASRMQPPVRSFLFPKLIPG